jgi:general secretion pathway protein I
VAPSRFNKGFTLIEILIATAVLGIALIAVLKSASNTVRDELYLQQKLYATWEAQNIVAQVNAGLIKAPTPGAMVSQTVNNFGQNWVWQLTASASAGDPLITLTVSVLDSTQKKMAILTTYQEKLT